jgi:predicted small metal-binding protein
MFKYVYIQRFGSDYMTDEGKYRFEAKKAGIECGFIAANNAREEVVRSAQAHAKMCSACANLTEEKINSAIEERA